jgi:uncharacterized protein YneF (UPF0154 family)
MPDRYDRVLIGIPLVLLIGAVLSFHPSVAIHQGLAGGSLIASVLLYEALFRHPPVEPNSADAAAAVGVGLGWALTLWTFL